METRIRSIMDADPRQYEQIKINEKDSHNIILSYLIHACYKDTGESLAASAGLEVSAPRLEDMDKRRRLLQLALEGNELEAITLARKMSPDVFKNNRDLHFDLLSLHFYELIRLKKRTEALEFAREKLTRWEYFPKYVEQIEDFMVLLAYEEPNISPMFYLLRPEYRQKVVDSLNRAILAEADMPSYSELERLIQQATAVRQCLSEELGQFQVLVACDSRVDLQEGIVLPKVCTKLLSEEGELNLKLVNLNGETYIVPAERTGEGCLKLEGDEWNEFVNSCPCEDVKKVCFKLKGCLTFEVEFFDSLDREFRWYFKAGESMVRTQLLVATEETLKKVKLSELLIDKVNGTVHNDYTWQSTVNIVGRKQNGSADVEYYSFREYDEYDGICQTAIGFGGSNWTKFCVDNCVDNDINGSADVEYYSFREYDEYDGICQTAIGFGGSNWTKFCVDNDIHPGNVLKFVDLEGLSFGVDVFTSEGVSVSMAELKEAAGGEA